VDIETILGIGRQTLEITLALAGPVLLAGLVAGVGVSLFQALTHINDMTLTLIPKMMAVIAALAVFGTWMLERLLNFTRLLIEGLPGFVG
jgi:flagellar biosynthetic protein FliQ